MIRPLAPGALLLALAACASSAAPATTFMPSAAPRDAVTCLTAALEKANYSIGRVDRRKGFVQASQPQDSVHVTDPREFRRLDVLTFEATKGGAWVASAAGLREFGTNAGNQQEPVEASARAARDAAAAAKSCGS